MDELTLIENPVHREPCEYVKIQLSDHGSGRIFNIGNLDGEPGLCVWCRTKLSGRRTRWCSNDCLQSALFLTNPQAPANKMYRLIFIQNFACGMCGQSYEDEIRARILKEWQHKNSEWSYGSTKHTAKLKEKTEKICLHRVGYGTGDIWQVDHIVPIHQGGKGIDPNNLQVLCVPCHKQKSIGERR